MQTSIDDFLNNKYRYAMFRKLVKLRTNYATHDLYPYPAKFIPNVVRYFIEASPSQEKRYLTHLRDLLPWQLRPR